jgi:UDP-N-acetylglucosamine acyltransferase
MIHPTAIVGPGVRLGENVTVGPHAVIEGEIEIGDQTEVLAGAIIVGTVKIGKSNRIGYGSVIGAYPQDTGFRRTIRSAVEIGDHNDLREHVTIQRGAKEGGITRVGSRNFLMVGAHLGHDTQVHHDVIVANNVLLAGHVEVFDRAFIGGGVAVHQFTRIGHIAMIQGTSATGKDIPPFAIAAGRNAVVGINNIGLRRAGFSRAEREEVQAAFRLLYDSGLTPAELLTQAATRQWCEKVAPFWQFIASTKRGICKLTSWRRIKAGGEEEAVSSEE